jgi:hypothetical protein
MHGILGSGTGFHLCRYQRNGRECCAFNWAERGWCEYHGQVLGRNYIAPARSAGMECSLWSGPNAGSNRFPSADGCIGNSGCVVGGERGTHQGRIQRWRVGGFLDPYRRESRSGGHVRATMTPGQSADSRTETPLLNRRRVLRGVWLFVPGALAALLPGAISSVLKVEPWMVGTAGLLAMAVGLFWSASGARCPSCRLNLLWHGMTHAKNADWFTWLVTVHSCPRCRHPESDRSGRHAG